MICVTTRALANALVNLIYLPASRFIHAPIVVAKIRTPVVAATNLCTHSMKYSSLGITPFGHSGHSGHVKPNPAAEMYPPTNMSEYRITRDANARYFRIKLLYNE